MEARGDVAVPHRTIVVCDDDEDERDLLGLLLRRRGIAVVLVGTGDSALAAIVSNRPDAAIVDLELPDMNGCNVARAVRGIGLVHVRLIALTGYGDRNGRDAALEAGFDDYFLKPTSVDILVAAADHSERSQTQG